MALELAKNVNPPETGNVTLLGASPWAVERAIRAARRQVDGPPEGFRYHDLLHSSPRC
jgi:hypothetical protein